MTGLKIQIVTFNCVSMAIEATKAWAVLLAWEKCSLGALPGAQTRMWGGSAGCAAPGGPRAVPGSWLGMNQLFFCLTYCKSCTLRNTTAAWFASIISPCPPANRPRWGSSPCLRSSRGLLGVARPGEDNGAWGTGPVLPSRSEAAPGTEWGVWSVPTKNLHP